MPPKERVVSLVWLQPQKPVYYTVTYISSPGWTCTSADAPAEGDKAE